MGPNRALLGAGETLVFQAGLGRRHLDRAFGPGKDRVRWSAHGPSGQPLPDAIHRDTGCFTAPPVTELAVFVIRATLVAAPECYGEACVVVLPAARPSRRAGEAVFSVEAGGGVLWPIPPSAT